MAKKFVRGITDVKTINNQDFDTNNVNDLLSDGQYNYIHRKKGKNEEYHNLTDNLKTLSSDNTELLTVTNNNKTTNTATLHPKHDKQKEQLLESTRDTVTIHHGTNGTAEKTTVDTNPQKVLEHENLISDSEYITVEHEEHSNTSEIKTDKLVTKLDELNNKIPTCVGVRNLLADTNQGRANWEWLVSSGATTSENYNVDGVKLTCTSDTSTSVTSSYIVYWGLLRHLIEPNTKYTLSFDVKPSVDVTFTASLMCSDRTGNITNSVSMNEALANKWTKVSCILTSKTTLPANALQTVFLEGMTATNGNWVIIKNIKLEKGFISSDWTPAPEDTQQQINSSLAQKQDKLTAGDGITIQGNTISASAPAPGATVSIQGFYAPDAFNASKHVVSIGQKTSTTFTFECYTEAAEHVLSGELKEELKKFIGSGYSASNGALKLTNDGTDMKLINSTPEYHNNQHATFTFVSSKSDGGGGGSAV